MSSWQHFRAETVCCSVPLMPYDSKSSRRRSVSACRCAPVTSGRPVVGDNRYDLIVADLLLRWRDGSITVWDRRNFGRVWAESEVEWFDLGEVTPVASFFDRRAAAAAADDGRMGCVSDFCNWKFTLLVFRVFVDGMADVLLFWRFGAKPPAFFDFVGCVAASPLTVGRSMSSVQASANLPTTGSKLSLQGYNYTKYTP